MRTYSCQLNHSCVKEFHLLCIWDHQLVEAAKKGWLVLLRAATAPSPLVRRVLGLCPRSLSLQRECRLAPCTCTHLRGAKALSQVKEFQACVNRTERPSAKRADCKMPGNLASPSVPRWCPEMDQGWSVCTTESGRPYESVLPLPAPPPSRVPVQDFPHAAASPLLKSTVTYSLLLCSWVTPGRTF